MGAPFFSTEGRARRDIILQLKLRRTSDTEAWKDYPANVRDLALNVSEAIRDDGVWPSNLFLPDDPADIPFAIPLDFTGDWDLYPYAMDLVENRLEVIMPLDFWEKVHTMTFEQALTKICAQKKRADMSNPETAATPTVQKDKLEEMFPNADL